MILPVRLNLAEPPGALMNLGVPHQPAATCHCACVWRYVRAARRGAQRQRGAVQVTRHASSLCLLAATVGGYLAGSALPPRVTQLLHPMITTALVANLSAWVMGLVTGAGFQATLKGYLTKARTSTSLCRHFCGSATAWMSGLDGEAGRTDLCGRLTAGRA